MFASISGDHQRMLALVLRLVYWVLRRIYNPEEDASKDSAAQTTQSGRLQEFLLALIEDEDEGSDEEAVGTATASHEPPATRQQERRRVRSGAPTESLDFPRWPKRVIIAQGCLDRRAGRFHCVPECSSKDASSRLPVTVEVARAAGLLACDTCFR